MIQFATMRVFTILHVCTLMRMLRYPPPPLKVHFTCKCDKKIVIWTEDCYRICLIPRWASRYKRGGPGSHSCGGHSQRGGPVTTACKTIRRNTEGGRSVLPIFIHHRIVTYLQNCSSSKKGTSPHPLPRPRHTVLQLKTVPGILWPKNIIIWVNLYLRHQETWVLQTNRPTPKYSRDQHPALPIPGMWRFASLALSQDYPGQRWSGEGVILYSVLCIWLL